MNRRGFVILALFVFCLAATLFTILPTRSATNPYDPWLDYNDDGTINMRDIQAEILSFNTFGSTQKPVVVDRYNFTGGYYEIILGPNDTGRINILTAGYRKIMLGFKASWLMPPPEENVSIATGFLLWNSTLCVDVDRFGVPPGWTGPEQPILYDYPVSRTYEVKGHTLIVAYYNPNQGAHKLTIEYYTTT